MTNGSVTTQDTSVSTPSSSPSPTSTSNSRDEFREMGIPHPPGQPRDLTLTKSVNLLANVPQKSETVKMSRPIVSATASLPLQPEMTSQSMYATLGVRHSSTPPPHYVHPNYATTHRRTSPTTDERRRPPNVTLVTATTSSPTNEGTLQKVKRIYL